MPLKEQAPRSTAPCYDLSGRRLEGQPSRKGIYIQNGRKLIVR